VTKNVGGPQDDKASNITTDKLKRFNDINGYDHGPATKPLQTEEDEEAEALDKVHDFPSMGSKANLLKGDGKSVVVSKILSRPPKSQAASSIKHASGKSSLSRVFMSKLQMELEEERKAREKLEKEIAEIKKINTELSTIIGLLTK
jgi:hypothetical protein